jgi:hypothetical protein
MVGGVGMGRVELPAPFTLMVGGVGIGRVGPPAPFTLMVGVGSGRVEPAPLTLIVGTDGVTEMDGT